MIVPLTSADLAAIAVAVADELERRGQGSQAPVSPYLDVDEAAGYLRCGDKQRVYDLVHGGALRPRRDGRRLLFHRDDLDAYLAPPRAATPAPSAPSDLRAVLAPRTATARLNPGPLAHITTPHQWRFHMTDRIEARSDIEFAPAWRPDPGDKLAGEVVAIGERAGEYDPYVIVTLRRDDGEELAIHAFHTVLARELAALRPKLGDRLAVKYVGKKPNRGGTGHYHAYLTTVGGCGVRGARVLGGDHDDAVIGLDVDVDE